MKQKKTMNNVIRNAIIGVIVVLFGIIFCACTLTRVDVGHIGLKIKLAGDTRGVQNSSIQTGWVWYNPLAEQVLEFPTSVQNISLTQNKHEGNDKKDEKDDHGIDESITFSSVEGVNANADVGFSFHIDPAQAPHLYARFRQNDMRALAYGYMRNVIRESFSEIASKMPIQEIYGAAKSKMIADTSARCQEILGKDGIVIDQLTINGALRLPQNVADAINNAMSQTQRAIESQNKVQQIKAEAEQVVTAAHGEAEAARQKAQGAADSLLITVEANAKAKAISSEAEAKANKMIQQSLTPQVLQRNAIDQWNGAMPQYVGGSNPMPVFNVR